MLSTMIRYKINIEITVSGKKNRGGPWGAFGGSSRQSERAYLA